MTAAIVGVVVLVVALLALVAWRWWLAERRFATIHQAAVRDEALASLEPRMRALEETIKAAQWAQVKR